MQGGNAFLVHKPCFTLRRRHEPVMCVSLDLLCLPLNQMGRDGLLGHCGIFILSCLEDSFFFPHTMGP